MWPHTGEYVPHQDSRDPTFTYYTFTPRPLREGRLYKMDDELAALLADTHQKLGFLHGMMKGFIHSAGSSAYSTGRKQWKEPNLEICHDGLFANSKSIK